jgi:hypothetical protein
VKRADYAGFKDRPEALDSLSMDCSNNVLTLGMIHGGMGEIFAKAFIASMVIAIHQVRDNRPN